MNCPNQCDTPQLEQKAALCFTTGRTCNGVTVSTSPRKVENPTVTIMDGIIVSPRIIRYGVAIAMAGRNPQEEPPAHKERNIHVTRSQLCATQHQGDTSRG